MDNEKSKYAADFSDFGGASYLNCAAQGPLPQVASAAALEALELKEHPELIRDEHYFSFPDAFRRNVSGLIGCQPTDIVVADSATHGIMLLVSGLDWEEGDEVVIGKGEFPANYFTWLSLEARGVQVHQVDLESGGDALASLESALTPRTRVVSLSWVRYTSGLRLDVSAIGELCRQRNVLFAIDGSQGLGGLRFDVSEVPCDLIACAGYKWLLGPYGIGFAYLRPDLAARLRAPSINWFSIAGARDFNRLSRCKLEFDPGASRFDINETANFFNLAAATASLGYLKEISVGHVEDHVRKIQDRLLGRLPAGLKPVSTLDERCRSNILCFEAENEEETEKAYRRLAERHVLVSHREGRIRISPNVYNSQEDVDRFLEAIEEAPGRGSRHLAPPVGERVSFAKPLQMPASRPILGESVSLQPLDPDRHAAELYSTSHGSEEKERLWTYLPYGPFADQESMQQWLQGLAGVADPLFFTIVESQTSSAIGMVAIQRIEPGHGCLEIGHLWYAPARQRTRTNTEVVYLLLRESFDALGYRRVEWKCDSLNRPSRAAALRLGFRFEGIFAQHLIVKGRNRDTAWYSLLGREWAAVRANLESWLGSDGSTSLSEWNRRLPPSSR